MSVSTYIMFDYDDVTLSGSHICTLATAMTSSRTVLEFL